VGLLAGGLALAAAAGGCFLPDNYSAPIDPVAVRERDGRVEVLYTSCDPQKVKLVQLVQPRDETVVKDDDPVVWQESFDPPTDRRTFAVPPDRQLGMKTSYVVWVTLADGLRVSGGFSRDRLAGGKVSNGGEIVSPEDFARTATCAPS